MKTIKLALLAAAATLAIGSAAHAEDAPPFKVAFNIGANSDYVFRGISQTDEDPSVYGGADATIGSIGYVGVWASNVDFGNSTDAEIDVYGGFKPVVGAVSFDLGAIYYGYVGSPSGSHQAYWEFKAAASVPAGPVTLGAAVFYSPEFFGKTGDAVYYEANAALAIPNTKFSLSGAVGHQTVDIGADYTTWNAGVGFALNDHIGFDLRYWDTAKDKFGSISSSRVVIGVKATF